ncbi:MAG: RHS repeat-associated core domain-containing protein [Chloroflexi bacterium]|nr:RHS repeat-associated core domain-containing protein [Chloroflexota bacterium]
MGSGSGVYDTIASFVYDGNGDRIQQVDYSGDTPVTTTYANDPLGLTQVLLANNGTTQTAQLYGLDLIGQDDGAGLRLLLADGLGSVRQEMAGGAVQTTTTYDPYGKLLAQTGTSGTVYGYTGEQEDAATGLVYLRARYYNPNTNQFMSRDPWNGIMQQPQTLNGYSYVLNNSVNFTDPSGLVCIFGFGNCDEEPEYLTIPWRLAPNNFCLPGNLGCWGDS